MDCSPLVPTIAEFLELPYNDEGHTIKGIFAEATFYPSGNEKDMGEMQNDVEVEGSEG